MKCLNVFVCCLIMAAFAVAANRTVYFAESPSRGFCAISDKLDHFYDAEGRLCDDNGKMPVRIRAINPPKNSSALYGIELERPFFILDGIYLSTTGIRSLSAFQHELEETGLFEILTELGYTPVIVQFAETVTRSLKENGEAFAKVLKFVNNNKVFGLTNRRDGFVVMGISQGGVLGRYGAYLYDKDRAQTDAPIRLYASLDSPHQGAVLPLSLYYTIEFWATEGGSAAAEAFRDLVDGPGARGLLLYDYKEDSEGRQYYLNTSSERFLFGEYRKAAEYKGFPAVLVAEGQLKGRSPEHALEYYKLNRHAEKLSILLGRAESNMASYDDGAGEISYNRVYKKWETDDRDTRTDVAKFDFVQGSTYPFAETIYNSLRDGFIDAMPEDMTQQIGFLELDVSTKWDDDTLMQKNSAFIPTVSAMDMNCGGNLAIRGSCAFTQNSSGFPFENPGVRSSAKAAYAVDPTHPRYDESISGRHVELPGDNSELYSHVVKGLQVDIWRMLCELANVDYDVERKAYSNEKLAGHFLPGTSCLDKSKIPYVIKTFGMTSSYEFAYSRYLYNEKASESDEDVSFDVPAGWHKVSLHDAANRNLDGSVFEAEVRVNSSNSNWMKAELLVSKNKSGAGQLQLKEIDIPMDGEFHRIRWNLPAVAGSMEHYRWFTMTLNSAGANVTVRNPRMFRSYVKEDVPTEKVSSQVYPGASYRIYPWTGNQSVTVYSDALGSGLEFKYGRIAGGIVVDFDDLQSMDGYSALKLTFWPGSCNGTGVYFDSYKKGIKRIATGRVENGFAVAEIPLEGIVNTDYTPKHKLAASRLVFESVSASESCRVRSIELK